MFSCRLEFAEIGARQKLEKQLQVEKALHAFNIPKSGHEKGNQIFPRCQAEIEGEPGRPTSPFKWPEEEGEQLQKDLVHASRDVSCIPSTDHNL